MTDTDTIKSLGSIAVDKKQLGDTYYKGVYLSEYKSYYVDGPKEAAYSLQDDNGYKIGQIYWFRYDPILWQIAENKTTGTVTLVCDRIIESMPYYNAMFTVDKVDRNGYKSGESAKTDDTRDDNGDGVADHIGAYSNNYKFSTIRTWLNTEFYETAFKSLTAAQKNYILATTVDNSSNTTKAAQGSYNSNTNKFVSANTSDKVFLLSVAEVTSTDNIYKTVNKKKGGTDYAKFQGLQVELNDNNKNYNCSSWWLRSPFDSSMVNSNAGYNSSYYSWTVTSSGQAYENGSVDMTMYGVVPVLRVKLS